LCNTVLDNFTMLSYSVRSSVSQLIIFGFRNVVVRYC
jgi:hypothetical protein